PSPEGGKPISKPALAALYGASRSDLCATSLATWVLRLKAAMNRFRMLGSQRYDSGLLHYARGSSNPGTIFTQARAVNARTQSCTSEDSPKGGKDVQKKSTRCHRHPGCLCRRRNPCKRDASNSIYFLYLTLDGCVRQPGSNDYD